MGRWEAPVGSYDFTPTEAIVTIASTGERTVLPIRSIDIDASRIVVTWTGGGRTSFGAFTGNSMTQLSQQLADGTLSPRYIFERGR